MRNLKRVLALVMAMVMILGMMVIGSSAASYSDEAAIAPEYADAVEILTGMGVFQGTGAGFAPKQTLSRAEAAALIYRVISADVDDDKIDLYDYSSFDDVKAGQWYTGYVTYSANGGYIVGDGTGKFNPSAKVTGVQVLKIMLSAMGYGAKGEFEGAAWSDNVLTVADDLGLLDNVNVNSLNIPASREIVAQLLFDAIQAPTTTYTPAFGYVNTYLTSAASLGWKNFGLTSDADKDPWGRPCTVWYDARIGMLKGTYATIEETPVATYYTKVDECDIAKDLGITKSAAIEAAYIDAVNTTVTNSEVTTDRTGTIDPLATTSLVGAQGCLTEVYDMGVAGYRFVEINTYLAQVTKVTPATTDRNGHTTDATVDLKVYLTDGTGTAFTGVKATGYAVNQYVLVNVNRNTPNAVKTITAATVTPMGQMKSWTPAYGTVAATTTIAATTYNDAVKFFLNNNKVYNNSQNWDVITDAYGNLIGLVPSTVNYLVVEKIEWKHDGTAIGNGKALANLVLATGEKVAGATVAKINNAPATATYISDTYLTGAVVADSYVNNTGYYAHIYTYSVNADGSYNIVKYCNENGASHNSGAVTFTTGKTSNITNVTGTVVADNNTVFLVKNKAPNDTHSYSVYKGINELPSMTVASGKLCFLSNGYFATLVVIDDYTLASNKFVAYAAIQNGYATGYTTNNGQPLYAYTVYPVGSTEATTIYSTTQGAITVDAFYEIEKAANGVATITTPTFMGAYGEGHESCGTYAGGKVMNMAWDRGYVKALNGDTVVNGTIAEGDTSVHNTYRVNANTKYFTVTKTTWSNGVNTVITASEAASLNIGDRIVVAYSTTASTEDVAVYVYILKTETYTQETITTPVTVTGIEIKADKSIGVTLSKDVAVGTSYNFALYQLTSGGYQKIGDFTATVQGNAQFAWVDMSSVLVSGNTYKAEIGTLSSYRAF